MNHGAKLQKKSLHITKKGCPLLQTAPIVLIIKTQKRHLFMVSIRLTRYSMNATAYTNL
ncbi:hypothetical protein JCM15093_657 [Bacteroides graminisolvens DSM 19988 = JCM 15093]|uniref:Uncharacterized protein n=1 Tax=Bacteroides graminisolvens DSM 19988 = JCM 15093 TaxID=1121097 RepID=A0A069CZW4_9BACE|nr:hypothetical protein JCM15093_657 [Bacteroides graminisolvens DSM 19988 = JCM 15093]